MRRNFAPLANAARSIIFVDAHIQLTEDLPMSEWKVELQGEAFDISALSYALIGTVDTIVEEEGKHYLCSSDFVAHSGVENVEAVREGAARILRRAAALLNLVEGINTKSVTTGNIFRRRGEGQDIYVFPETGRIWAPLVTFAEPNTSQRKLDLARGQELYKVDNKVRRAVDFFHKDDTTYRYIYNTYEIIRDDLGGGPGGANRIAVLASVDPSDLEVFYANAQHESLSGEAARHAGESRSKKQPKVPTRMPVEVARDLIGRILIAWMESKL